MLVPPPCPAVFGPFDGDFDPFEDDEDIGPLVTFGRSPHRTSSRRRSAR